MSVEKISFNGVGTLPQLKKQSEPVFNGQKYYADEEKSNAAKYMIGAAALAGVVALGIIGHKGYLGKTVQKVFGGKEKSLETLANDNHFEKVELEKFASTLDADIKVNPYNKSAIEQIDYVDKLNWAENSELGAIHHQNKQNLYEELNWDAKPYPAKVVRKLEHDRSIGHGIGYIRNDIEKEFDTLRKQGYKISVKDLKDGYKKITYIYPKNSPIKSKTIHAKFMPEDTWFTKDKKSIDIVMKNGKQYGVEIDMDTMKQSLMQLHGDAFATKYQFREGGATHYVDYIDDLINKFDRFLDKNVEGDEVFKELVKELNV